MLIYIYIYIPYLQKDVAKVKVSRWYPGVVEEITEHLDEKQKTKFSIAKRLLSEADANLQKKQQIQTNATKFKTVEEILRESTTDPSLALKVQPAPDQERPVRARRTRQRMRSTPVVGGGLFEDPNQKAAPTPSKKVSSSMAVSGRQSLFQDDGYMAEIIVNGESYQVKITREAYRNVRRGYLGEVLNDKSLSSSGMRSDAPVVNRLQGFVRKDIGLTKIMEESNHSDSDMSESVHQHEP